MAELATGRVGKLLGLSVAAAVAATAASVAPAEAHGEKSQQAFLRMRTLNWYDVKWSKTSLNVNESMVLSGKVHVFSAWPQAVANPKSSFLNAGEPGPVLVRTAQFIGEQFAPRSVSLEVGKDYAFSIDLKARRAGRWHVHAQINVEGGGPIIGPGQWIEIKGDMADFKDPVTLLDGTTVDLETYGIDRIYAWHFPWMIAAAAWILYWFFKKGIIASYLRISEGKDEEQIGDDDRRVGAIVLAVTILATIIGYAVTNSTFPRTIPLQAGLQKPLTPIIEEGTAGVGPHVVTAELKGGVYKVPGRELTIQVKVTNKTDEPLKLGEYTAAGLRFLNPDVFTTKPEFPDYLLADRGLSTDPTPLAPGETKTIEVKVQDARWDIERLSDLAYDTDSQIGGLLMFFSPSGKRYATEIGGPVIPKFVAGDMP
ncbi:methane monooxygenase/ammonia monooxygenase subunit B [Methylosinus trichosporium OB3b]|uniref:Methane monooxygenase/ammonia monooxygenase subunit B n=3 Tax=Methylosinus trichosporium TaxID=426 RepID=A0A2D2D5S7_METT3|nr:MULTISPECIES: bacterial ammonia monooxygenase, subunit AmoB [Methylosinus]ATQ70154.1 methane monooxygenase/ammonia monooxygenase subunit B [Methylosinus trichosporium OB3b]ATQ70325.1 methane monooxygenase/ammonia monooxygenase subunit B [Methylosinus trichosporium OB3b]OBS50619.1 methane monooxygenase/ammonia monooxygenase subunit B [Methylosinus sp. 3S-1]